MPAGLKLPTGHDPWQLIASRATWKVLRLATFTGAPFQLPYMVRIGEPAPSFTSSDWISQLLPDPLGHDRTAVSGTVVTEGEAVVAVVKNGAVEVCPPAV